MSPLLVDYYAVLQVHPDAEHEVIEAAYRQLMRKYHPDVAGDDPWATERLHERAKAINQAYAVLRDPQQRRIYDGMRQVAGTRPPPPRTTPPSSTVDATWRAAVSHAPPDAEYTTEIVVEPWYWRMLTAPWMALTSLYYLLPGPYEWDPGSTREVVRVCAVPPLGVACWLAATGRLDPLVGGSLFATVGVWAVIGLIALLVMGSALPRLIAAGGLTLLLANGSFDATIANVHVPPWLAWVGVSGVSLLLAARVYVFGVLPTLGLCWLLARQT
jgi:hypothetical protein